MLKRMLEFVLFAMMRRAHVLEEQVAPLPALDLTKRTPARMCSYAGCLLASLAAASPPSPPPTPVLHRDDEDMRAELFAELGAKRLRQLNAVTSTSSSPNQQTQALLTARQKLQASLDNIQQSNDLLGMWRAPSRHSVSSRLAGPLQHMPGSSDPRSPPLPPAQDASTFDQTKEAHGTLAGSLRVSKRRIAQLRNEDRKDRLVIAAGLFLFALVVAYIWFRRVRWIMSFVPVHRLFW